MQYPAFSALIYSWFAIVKVMSVLCSVLVDGSAPVNWIKGRRLGAGSFGQVFICHDRDTGRDLAIKEVLVLCPNDKKEVS